MDTLHLDQTLTELIKPLLEERSVELVELSVSGGRRRKLVRIFVDRSQGITIGECASLSREIADLFDTRDPLDGGYVLEVSSPGLTRPLKTDSDFERAVGKSLRLVVDGLGVRVGTLLQVNSEHLNVDLDGEQVAIDRAQIQKATLHFEL
jgi:ribosome maturation factor RimP